MNRLTQEVYRKIYFELMNTLKEDNNFQKSFSREQIKFIEQNWCKKLEEQHILLNTNVDISQMLQFPGYPKSFKDPIRDVPKEQSKIEFIENSILQ